MTSSILVVDDDPAVCDTIEDALHLGGFSTVRANDGLTALELVRSRHISLVILDINMSRTSGLEVLERLNKTSPETPVILLTANQAKPAVLDGLRAGADDYITKPFGIEELLLRIKAVLRRTATVAQNTLRCGSISMDLDRHSVEIDGDIVELSATEFRLLEYLLKNKNRVVSKSQILDAVWGINYQTETTVVETYVSYLRRKIGSNGQRILKTVRGVGFSLEDAK
jgi:two-component system OmpR family response regulator